MYDYMSDPGAQRNEDCTQHDSAARFYPPAAGRDVSIGPVSYSRRSPDESDEQRHEAELYSILY